MSFLLRSSKSPRVSSEESTTLTTMAAINDAIIEVDATLESNKQGLNRVIEQYKKADGSTREPDIIAKAKEVAMTNSILHELQELEKLNDPAAKTGDASKSGGRKSRRRKYIKRKKTNRRI
jgi:hypothetical protein